MEATYSMNPTDDDDPITTERYELKGSDVNLEAEHILREDWDGMMDPCPECDGTEFDHLQYSGGQYGQENQTVIERADYWDQKGSLYTACKECDEVLFKHPAYDIIEAWTEKLQGDS
jgi:hypothetical protein